MAAPVPAHGQHGNDPGRACARQHLRQSPSLRFWRQGGEWCQAIGRARGGRTSKIHCLADDRGRPVAFALTPGNIADISVALPLLSSMPPPRRLIADKAYDADGLRGWLEARHIRAVIPSTASRTIPYPLNRKAYARRNLIERLFCRLKNWRRIATRYDRLAQNYLAALALVAVASARAE
nr:IS5 family transposase [Geminicoccus harenae]